MIYMYMYSTWVTVFNPCFGRVESGERTSYLLVREDRCPQKNECLVDYVSSFLCGLDPSDSNGSDRVNPADQNIV